MRTDGPGRERADSSALFSGPASWRRLAVNIRLELSSMEDAEHLADLRVTAMRESLTRIGRFDLHRARARLLDNFDPRCTRHIVVDGFRAGCVVTRIRDDHLLLDHLYVLPAFQRCGVGAAVLRTVIDEALVLQLPILLGALRDSDANAFYLRHGFVKTGEQDVDIYYVRAIAAVPNAPIVIPIRNALA